MSKIIFITGTDTGVGKTLLTASLVYHLREAGLNALAIKPFCSGGMADVDLLEQIQGGALSAKEINPFRFPNPVTPLLDARRQGRRIGLAMALGTIERLSRQTECLIVEGAGGLLAPLGERFSLADLIEATRGDVIVVGANRLGILNHTLLTVEALRGRGVERRRVQVVLMGQAKPDLSARSNRGMLMELLAPIEISTVPFLGLGATRLKGVRGNVKKIKKTLAHIWVPLMSRLVLWNAFQKGGPEKKAERVNAGTGQAWKPVIKNSLKKLLKPS